MKSRVAFDQSTIFYANRFLTWLAFPGKLHRDFVSALADAFNGIETYPEDGILIEACRRVGENCSKGVYSLTGVAGGEARIMNVVTQLLFGILCLEKIAQGICLSDEIGLLPSPWACHVSSLEECGDKFLKTDSEYNKIWLNLKPEIEKHQMVADWMKGTKLISDSKLATTFRSYASRVMSLPYMRLGEYLADVSNGRTEHLLIREGYFPYGTRDSYLSADQMSVNSDLHYDPIENQVGTARLFPYMLNAFPYNYIARLYDIKYICNDYREPFLNAMTMTQNLSSFDCCTRAFEFALFGIKPSEKLRGINISHSKLPDIGHSLLSYAINEADSVHDIVPALYHIRDLLHPFREKMSFDTPYEISKKDVDEIERYLSGKGIGPKATFGIGVLQVEVPDSWLKWITYEAWKGNSPHLAAVVSLRDRYRNASMVFEGLIRLLKDK